MTKRSDRSRREHPSTAHSLSELTQVVPPLHIPAADIASCNDAWRLASLTEKGRKAAANTLEIMDALAKRYERMAKILKKGGTFSFPDINEMLLEDRAKDKITQKELDEGRAVYRTVTGNLIEATSQVTDAKLKKITYKAYGPTKEGVGLHRDSAFPGNETAEVASVNLRGANQFSVWAVPAFLELDMETSLGRVVDPSVGVLVNTDEGVNRLLPVSTVTQAPGGIVHINEAQGVWVSDTLGPMSIWHSARRAHEHEPRLGAIIRS